MKHKLLTVQQWAKVGQRIQGTAYTYLSTRIFDIIALYGSNRAETARDICQAIPKVNDIIQGVLNELVITE